MQEKKGKKKKIWLTAGKQLNAGTAWAGAGFLAFLALIYNNWNSGAWCVAVVSGLFSCYVFISAVKARKKKKDSVSYSQLWGTFALTVLLIAAAVLTAIIGGEG